MPKIIIAKPCTQCGAEKFAVEFSKKRAAKDGLQSICKACMNARSAAAYIANPDKKNASRDAWRAANGPREKSVAAAYRAKNRDKQKERGAIYQKVNAEKIKERAAVRYAANPERYQASNENWRAKNPEAYHAYAHNRRARKLEVGGILSSDLSARLFKRQRGKCACCKLPLGAGYHRDHIMPLALGGSNTDDNIQLLRAVCNRQKSKKHPVDFMQARGFLL